jgi:hypothetical protein
MVIISSSPKQVTFLTPQDSMSDESTGEVSESLSFQQDAMLVLTNQAVIDSRTVVVEKKDSKSSLESMMVLHLGHPSDCGPSVGDSHKLTSEKLLADMRHNPTVGALQEDRQEDTEIQNKNIMYFAGGVSVVKPTVSSTDTSPLMDDNSFCSSSTGNNNLSDFQLPVANTGNAVFKKRNGNIMSSPSVLGRIKGPSATRVETGLKAFKRNLPSHEMSLAHVQVMESLPLLSSIGEVHDKAAYARKKYVYPVTSVGKGESSV